ncbi:MAG: Acetolactate synthase [candidate division WS6 bacterium GW2011_GWF2_39_15]|uniref:Acetolactate synthase n=1 Tax=candidate division WS6 bacterium GW2011_GWF2_39_15 TaxID=1619100 RepID=A0A0G0QWY1_9BACT|nr:MAG: Acetolactate synthase [candidate division WS6 bacterium GW2011_GWF2_39_15]
MKFYEYINKTLKEYGCRKAFGVPGGQVKPLWQNMDDIEIITCAHEQEASYVATGYSKASGELVAVITIGSPGVTNCASGIASANMDSVPMIYISGQPPVRFKGLGSLQEESQVNRSFDSADILKKLTKQTIEINNITNAAQIFSDSCKKALSGRTGCVHISIPVDIQAMELPESELIHKKAEKKEVAIPNLPKITKPLVIIGWGSWQAKATKQIYELAEKIGAPVLVTSKASCCIWGEHPNYLGKLGYGYNPVLEKFIEEYSPEQVLVFGSSMARKNVSESFLNIIKRATTYLYSIECEDVTFRFPSGNWIQVDDMASMIKLWIKNVKPSKQKIHYNLKTVRENQMRFFSDNINDQDLMAKAILELNNLCDETCVISADAGNHLLDAAIMYEPKQIGGMFLDVGIRAMGSGPCTSTGMAVALRDKFQIAVTGDGSMLMNGNVMAVAKRMNLPILFLVTNNSSLGRVRIGQMDEQKFIGTDLENIDFTMYGKTFGLKTYTASSIDEFRSAMKKILAEKKTALLELLTDKDEIPPSLKGKPLF